MKNHTEKIEIFLENHQISSDCKIYNNKFDPMGCVSLPMLENFKFA